MWDMMQCLMRVGGRNLKSADRREVWTSWSVQNKLEGKESQGRQIATNGIYYQARRWDEILRRGGGVKYESRTGGRPTQNEAEI